MNKSSQQSEIQAGSPSSVKGMTRRQFIDATVKRAVLAGTILGGAALVDSFVVRPAYASTSTTLGTGSNPSDSIDFG